MTDRMVGRLRELTALGAWLDGARSGAGRLVLCVGEPDIGKTRLAQEFAGVALASGIAVSSGRCVEVKGAPAFWPWRQVLRSLGFDPHTVLGWSPSVASTSWGRTSSTWARSSSL